MASRNRPRGAFVKEDPSDAHEERNMWSQIVTDIKRLKATHARAAELAKQQVELEGRMGKCECCAFDLDCFGHGVSSELRLCLLCRLVTLP